MILSLIVLFSNYSFARCYPDYVNYTSEMDAKFQNEAREYSERESGRAGVLALAILVGAFTMGVGAAALIGSGEILLDKSGPEEHQKRTRESFRLQEIIWAKTVLGHLESANPLENKFLLSEYKNFDSQVRFKCQKRSDCKFLSFEQFIELFINSDQSRVFCSQKFYTYTEMMSHLYGLVVPN